MKKQHQSQEPGLGIIGHVCIWSMFMFLPEVGHDYKTVSSLTWSSKVTEGPCPMLILLLATPRAWHSFWPVSSCQGLLSFLPIPFFGGNLRTTLGVGLTLYRCDLVVTALVSATLLRCLNKMLWTLKH